MWLARAWQLPLALCGLLAACSSTPPRQAPAPVEVRQPGLPVPPPPPTGPSAVATLPEGTLLRTRSRWLPAAFGDLPGWGSDRASEVLPALRRSCTRPADGWAALCAQVREFQPADDLGTRRWLEDRLRVYRIESLEGDSAGLITGYYEPLVTASRKPQDSRRVPLWSPPHEAGGPRSPWTRQELDSLPEAQAAVRGREIAWLADPLDALVLQIQGSGRLRLTEADGSERLVRLAYADHNDQPYRSVGRWLIDQGELKAGEASWPAIKDWARRNPRRVQELLWQNPRMVFFREEALPDPQLGPKGAQGVPLTPGRSVAVDPLSVPYGSLLWLDTTEPLSERPLQRLVVAQDTGSAIVGAVRADFFWGWGDTAESQAGRMKQPLRAWALWPQTDLR